MSLTKAAAVKLLDDFRYTLPNDVSMRLGKSFVKYRGEIAWVHRTYDDLNLGIVFLDKRDREGQFKEAKIHSSDVDLDISSPVVGWTNNENYGPIYLMRQARNSQKQGLNPQACVTYHPRRKNPLGEGYGYQRWEDLLPVADCIMNRYPNIEQCTGYYGGAFSREWALVNPKDSDKNPKYLVVFHKTIPVGTYFVNTKTFFFRRGRLTKTRRHSLENIFYNAGLGGYYGIKEQI